MEEKLKKFSEEFFGKSMKFLNLEFVSAENEIFTFSCEFNEHCENPMGFVQGGMITTALDDATSAAVISGYQEKKAPMTTDLHVLFHRPLPVGKAIMEVKIIKLGSRSATSEGRMFNLDKKLVATLMHTAQPVDIS